jgi:hypothetical protein
MKTWTVLLDNDTTGTIAQDTIDGKEISDFIGERMTAKSHDENGNEIEVTGKLTEVLEEN